jgi:Holliday junction resolvase
MNVKKKGNAGENAFANWLHSKGVKAWRNGSSGAGMYKGDINNSIDCTFEVKTVKKINLKEAWYQVNRDASIARNMPVLSIRFDGMPKDEWLMVTHSEDFIEMLKHFHGIN